MTVSRTSDFLGVVIIHNLKRLFLLYLVSWICHGGSYMQNWDMCPVFVVWTIFSKLWISYLTEDFFLFQCEFIINILLGYRFDYFQILLTDI